MFMMCLASVEAAASYEVVFRAGSKGSFDASSLKQDGLKSVDTDEDGNVVKVVYEVALETTSGEVGYLTPDVVPAEGYTFQPGWEIDP